MLFKGHIITLNFQLPTLNFFIKKTSLTALKTFSLLKILLTLHPQ